MDYELDHIETIVRGIAVRDGKILLCKAKGGESTYLPGGHIELGETGREALVREIKEETGLNSAVGRFLGVVENSFVQKGKKHSEINLVFELNLDSKDGLVNAAEDWIEFEWCDLSNLDAANLLPEVFRGLKDDPKMEFCV